MILSISDQGLGIPSRICHVSFDRFYRVDRLEAVLKVEQGWTVIAKGNYQTA